MMGDVVIGFWRIEKIGPNYVDVRSTTHNDWLWTIDVYGLVEPDRFYVSECTEIARHIEQLPNVLDTIFPEKGD